MAKSLGREGKFDTYIEYTLFWGVGFLRQGCKTQPSETSRGAGNKHTGSDEYIVIQKEGGGRGVQRKCMAGEMRGEGGYIVSTSGKKG